MYYKLWRCKAIKWLKEDTCHNDHSDSLVFQSTTLHFDRQEFSSFAAVAQGVLVVEIVRLALALSAGQVLRVLDDTSFFPNC